MRIYGKVTGETARVPQVAVDYIRVWPWMTFTFTDLAGEDTAIRAGMKYSRSTAPAAIEFMFPIPDENYYLNVLGDPADFGLNLRPD